MLSQKYLKLFPSDQQRAVELHKKVAQARRVGVVLTLVPRDVSLLWTYEDFLGEPRTQVSRGKVKIK